MGKVVRQDARTGGQTSVDILAAMDHGIRTPMSGVLGMIDLLHDARSEKDRRQYLAALKDSAHALLATLDRLLTSPAIRANFGGSPRRDIDQAQLAGAPLEADGAGTGERSLHILVAEDNPVSQLLITALVRRMGHRSTCVGNGWSALESAQAVPFDCILMDLRMPEMDGIAATRAIRALGRRNATVPIIVLTADVAPDRHRFYDNAGLTAFLPKPIDAKRLHEYLSRIASAPASAPAAPDSAPVAPDSAPVAIDDGEIDLDRVDDLRAVIGDAKLANLIGMLTRELADYPAAMRASAAGQDVTALRAQSHRLKGAADNLGLSGVARAATAVELALPGTEIELALERLDRAIGHARTALASLLESLVPLHLRSA